VGERQKYLTLFQKAETGAPLTIAFLGGSITEGSLASSEDTCFAYRVFLWFEEMFPKTDFTYVNAGVGGTTSHFGAARVHDDVIAKGPDFVCIDFSVNDEGDEAFFEETFEGVVRQLLNARTQPALLVLANARYDDGRTFEAVHKKIADHYGIPVVSLQKSAFFKDVRNGKTKMSKITPDGLHPNDLGHEKLAELIEKRLLEIREEVRGAARAENGSAIPAPLTRNGYEHTRRYTALNALPSLSGFSYLARPVAARTKVFHDCFAADKEGDAITFSLPDCSSIAVQYRQVPNRPAVCVSAVIDKDTEHAVILDGAFPETWGENLALTILRDHGPFGDHTLTLRAVKAGRQDAPFLLTSVITD